jgi:hypothetical protein
MGSTLRDFRRAEWAGIRKKPGAMKRIFRAWHPVACSDRRASSRPECQNVPYRKITSRAELAFDCFGLQIDV